MGQRLWKIGGRTMDCSRRALVMGVLNVTPDSFSDGGLFHDPDHAVAQASRLAADGADIIDLGGESTRPDAPEVSAEEELARLLPVLDRLPPNERVMLSIDTAKAKVARAALERGAVIINDVTAGRADPGMFPLAAERGAGIILMHMQGSPRTMQAAPHYEDVVAEVAEFFRQQYARAIESGIDPMTIAFDPGIGFGKTLEHNLALLGGLEKLRVHDRPLVVGVSRKSFLGRILGRGEMADRSAPTIGLSTLLRARGADVLRVHEVRENVQALRVAEAVLEAAS